MITAAGGVLIRKTRKGDSVMLVYREHYDDWSLPKGKLKRGESFEEAALREVEEETGCTVRLEDYIGEVHYEVGDEPKVVRFWRMSLVREGSLEANQEVDEAAWFPVLAAMERLTYSYERDLLLRAFPKPGQRSVASM